MSHFDQGRRVALQSIGATLLLSAAGAVAQSAPKRSSTRALTITYPAGAGIRFDANYYRDYHGKLFMDIYGPAIERFELRLVAQSPADPFLAVINVWIADFDLFHARSTEAAYKRMGDDKKNFTNTSSSIQVDEVRYEVGENRASIPIDCTCLSLLYPAGEAGGWNDDKRCKAYAEGVKQLLGADALRRIELRKGIEQLDDGAPTYQGAINIYARNSGAFSQSWQKHEKALEDLSTQLCSSKPVKVSTTVFGIESTHV